MINILALIALLLFLVHSIFNLERIIYINEIYSLFGFISFVYFRKLEIHRPNINKPHTILEYFLIYLTVRFALSIPFYEGDLLPILRMSVIWYSIFSFYLGIQLASMVRGKSKKLFSIAYPLMVISPERLSMGLFSILSSGFRSNKIILMLIILGLLIQGTFHQVSTPVFSALIVLIIYFTKKYLFSSNKLMPKKIVQFSILLSTTLLALLYVLNRSYYFEFVDAGYEYYGINADSNMYWRLNYWYYLISSTLQNDPIFGLGFARKLFDISNDDLWWLIIGGTGDNTVVEYILGPHNSLIYIFARTGLIGFIIFVTFLSSMFRILWIDGRIGLISAFVIINVSMLLNVILESPIWALNYWLIMGLIYKEVG